MGLNKEMEKLTADLSNVIRDYFKEKGLDLTVKHLTFNIYGDVAFMPQLRYEIKVNGVLAGEV